MTRSIRAGSGASGLGARWKQHWIELDTAGHWGKASEAHQLQLPQFNSQELDVGFMFDWEKTGALRGSCDVAP